MIEISDKQLERVNTILSGVKGGADKVITRAVKRGQQTARVHTVRAVKEVYDITPSNIKASSRINLRTRKSDGNIVGEVSFSGYKIPLFKFKATPRTSGQKKLVKARQMRANAMTPFAHAFVATMPSGHIGIFEREGRERLHIQEKMGSSVGQMASNVGVVEQVETKVQEVINNRLEHGLNDILNRYGGK